MLFARTSHHCFSISVYNKRLSWRFQALDYRSAPYLQLNDLPLDPYKHYPQSWRPERGQPQNHSNAVLLPPPPPHPFSLSHPQNCARKHTKKHHSST